MIIGWIEHIIVWVFWKMGLIHIPEWDNIDDPFRKKETPKSKAQVLGSLLVTPEGTDEYLYGGLAEPGKEQKRVKITTIKSDDGTAWDLARWDGSISLDFSDWTEFDQIVCDKRGFNETDIRNYQAVKPMILQRKTNKNIAEHFGMKMRWAEKYGAAGREMIGLRIQALNHSPIGDLGEGAAE